MNEATARRQALEQQLRAAFDSDAARALRRDPWRSDPGAVDSAGHCYIASEVLWHALGGMRSVWRPAFMRWEGAPHWFLRSICTGTVLDATRDQFHQPPAAHDYACARGCGFLTRAPSMRARKLAALAGLSI